jgi:hypothetical protein
VLCCFAVLPSGKDVACLFPWLPGWAVTLDYTSSTCLLGAVPMSVGLCITWVHMSVIETAKLYFL